MFTLMFKGFVYNQIWEDPEVDMEALALQPHHQLITIASGGCNVLNYLAANPARIIAVDLNQNHVALTRLKLALALLPDDENRAGMVGDLNEMEAMITELLELERMREGRGLRRERRDLVPLLRELAEVYSSDSQGVRFLAPPGIWLDIDREKIRIVLRNLLENARKFSLPDSGPIEITVETDGGNTMVRVCGLSARDTVETCTPAFCAICLIPEGGLLIPTKSRLWSAAPQAIWAMPRAPPRQRAESL